MDASMKPAEAVLKGSVSSGTGKAADFLSMDRYAGPISRMLDGPPVQGTLNLQVEKEAFLAFRSGLEAVRVEPFAEEGRAFGGLTCYPVTVRGVKGVLLVPDKAREKDTTAELVARVNLRKQLGLYDGDVLEVRRR